MAGAVTTSPKRPPQTQPKQSLWGDIEIPIIIGTGEYGQGKTVFGLCICPGPQTLVYDNEGSSLTYRSLGFDHVDMAAELAAKYPNGYTPRDRFHWWREDVMRRAASGKYRVIMIDPASELEDGLAAEIRANPRKYELTDNQIRASSGLFWGAMKVAWKAILDDLRTKVETLYMIVHMRDQYVGNSPSGKREPKGKETLFELASLFLQFERVPLKRGGPTPDKPSAIVLKSRLTKFIITTDGEAEPRAILPPRIPIATPKAIRDYIANPPDYSHLSEAEQVHEKELSEEERLRLQVTAAEANRVTSENELALVDKRAAAAERAATVKRSRPQASDQAGEVPPVRRTRAAAAKVMVPSTEDQLDAMMGGGCVLTGTSCSVCGEPQFESPGGDTCKNGHGGAPPINIESGPIDSGPHAEQLEAIQDLRERLDRAIGSPEWYGAALVKRRVKSPRDLTPDQAAEMIASMQQNLIKLTESESETSPDWVGPPACSWPRVMQSMVAVYGAKEVWASGLFVLGYPPTWAHTVGEANRVSDYLKRAFPPTDGE